jgi:thioredoxin-related protein
VYKKIELVANVAIIITAVLLVALAANRFIFSPQSVPADQAVARQSIKVGERVTLPDFNWAQSERTLLLVLSTSCHFCTESAPFYQRLAQEKTKRGGTRLVAVLPQDPTESQKYLSDHGVSVDEIRRASLDEVQVRGTPTLILADQTGAVITSWIGKLPPDKEAEVLSRL